MLSLKARVLLGGLFWTLGLLGLSSATLVMAIEHSGSVRAVLGVHQVFTSPWLLAAAVLSLIAGGVQIRRGLAPINTLRGRLARVHDGRDQRIDGHYVPEVQPLVDDLNALLAHREHAVRRAVAKAGDLAHGLKTPLALLMSESERAEAAGQSELARAIAQHIERMRRQIDYHLAHARAAASGATPGARSSIKDCAECLARTMLHLHAERDLSIDVRVRDDHTARMQREDLDEILGNLLDNACKWTRSRIVVDAAEGDRRIVLTVDDDGPGLPPTMRTAVLERGVRADEQAPGSGLGLAIVRDIVELHHGSILLDESPLGGLRVTLTLPKS